MLMNLNRCASEIATDVQDGERYSERMADPDDDDRGEALAWFFRDLVQQEIDRGATRKELYEKFGIGKGHLSQIENGKLGLGVPKIIQFSGYFNWTPGEMLDRALGWWERSGRKEKARVLLEHAQEAERKAAKKAARSAHESGEHPSQSPQKAAK